jgi:2-keto-4-pentenoate hydratase/2-oxohepta-3-ene-1,7-dioic acid hydratase in catechol pathway
MVNCGLIVGSAIGRPKEREDSLEHNVGVSPMTLLDSGGGHHRVMTTLVTRYVRYWADGQIAYGIQDGETIKELDGNFLTGTAAPTGKSTTLDNVKLLAPCEPSKVIAVGRNYQSHLGDRAPLTEPGVFLKLPSAVIATGDAIVIPPGATDVHYEGELVVVIGKPASRITREEAPNYIFGVTAGNDVSERQWQKNDVQWFRAKASDTFAPLGPAIARGLNYNDLKVESRINGEVRQSQRTSDMLFDVETMVSYVSQFITLSPGDVLYTGCPGKTRAMQPGDTVEVEVEGVGILRNTVR